MGDRFDWQFDESAEGPPPQEKRVGRSALTAFWLAALLITATVISTWAVLRRQEQQEAASLTASAQTVLDLLHQAVADGDGELFYALQEPDSDWATSQLSPEAIAFFRAKPVITNIQQGPEMLHASASWQADGRSYQRVLFFAPRAGSLRLAFTDPAYWGAQQQTSHQWGTLAYPEIDAAWNVEISSFINEAIASFCRAGCEPDRLPLAVKIRPDFVETAAPSTLALPSPRLVGLDQAGYPSDRFWRLLRARLNDYLMPATLRFAVPDERFPHIDYEAAAEAFTAHYPDLEIEITRVQSLPATRETLSDFDGAAFMPTTDMIAAGLVRDLTPYARSDPAFDTDDFYAQIWQAAIWRDRQWAMPQAAEMPLIFYHRDAYRSLDRQEPLIGWTWAEAEEDALALTKAQLDTGEHLLWGYLDQSLDSLYSYAFSRQTACGAVDSRPCPLPLGEDEIAAALEWHARLTEAGAMPDVSRVPPYERYRLLINSFYKTAVWVDRPVFYEHRTLMFPMGVLPMPGSDHFESSTPLWVRGGFASAHSERPLATWQWLKFLSHWPPRSAYRLIPARPSVTTETGFWNGLPRPLAEPMRVAFPLARPVRLQERTLFDWSTIRAVAGGVETPREAAKAALTIDWFGE